MIKIHSNLLKTNDCLNTLENILIVNKIIVLNTSSRIGGAEKSLQDVLDVLEENNIIWVALPTTEALYAELSKKFKIKNHTLERLEKSKTILLCFSSIFQIFNTSYQISRLVRKEKIDLIYANANHSNLYAILVKLFTGKKIIWHMRDNLNNKLLSLLLSILSDKIICISEHLSKQIFFPNKTQIIYNGIDTHKWKLNNTTPSLIKKELSLEPDRILIAQVGQLIPWKNHLLLIDIAKNVIRKNPKVFFIVLGEDTFKAFPDYNKLLLSRIHCENLENHFSLLGYKENIKEYLSEIDILVHLAEGEPFGRVLIEAMALEKPVVAINSGGPAEIIEDNNTGFLVEKTEQNIIVEKLVQLSEDQVLRKKFGRNGRMLVERNFSIRNLRKVQEIISSIA